MNQDKGYNLSPYIMCNETEIPQLGRVITPEPFVECEMWFKALYSQGNE